MHSNMGCVRLTILGIIEMLIWANVVFGYLDPQEFVGFYTHSFGVQPSRSRPT